jgi:predicted DNA binding CopG/RHH family protein
MSAFQIVVDVVACVYDLHMLRVNIFLPEPVVAALKALSEKTGMSYAEHIRRAIDAYLKRNS